MFISAELSQPASLKFLIHDFDWLREDLVKAEEYSDAFKLAFCHCCPMSKAKGLRIPQNRSFEHAS